MINLVGNLDLIGIDLFYEGLDISNKAHIIDLMINQCTSIKPNVVVGYLRLFIRKKWEISGGLYLRHGQEKPHRPTPQAQSVTGCFTWTLILRSIMLHVLFG